MGTSKFERWELRPSPRTTQPDLSPVDWVAVRSELYGVLRHRGATHENAEDITQDVVFKALSKQVPFADAEDLLRFAHHAAHHL